MSRVKKTAKNLQKHHAIRKTRCHQETRAVKPWTQKTTEVRFKIGQLLISDFFSNSKLSDFKKLLGTYTLTFIADYCQVSIKKPFVHCNICHLINDKAYVEMPCMCSRNMAHRRCVEILNSSRCQGCGTQTRPDKLSQKIPDYVLSLIRKYYRNPTFTSNNPIVNDFILRMRKESR